MMKMPEEINVIHNMAADRFEVDLDGKLALIDYLLVGDHIAFLHTEVPEEYSGQGIAGRMAKTALEYAKDKHLRVSSLCSYMDVYIARHPAYQNLLNK